MPASLRIPSIAFVTEQGDSSCTKIARGSTSPRDARHPRRGRTNAWAADHPIRSQELARKPSASGERAIAAPRTRAIWARGVGVTLPPRRDVTDIVVPTARMSEPRSPLFWSCELRRPPRSTPFAAAHGCASGRLSRWLVPSTSCNDAFPALHISVVSPLATEPTASDVPRADASPFEVLYRREVAAVMAFFARRSRDPHLVFDLTADTFVEAMGSFGSSPPAQGSERPWLLTIARRVYAKHCERAARRQDASQRDAARQILDGDEIAEVTARIDAERLGRELLAELRGLPLPDREAVELVDLADMSPREAAKVLGVSSGALRVRLFRARSRLRKIGAKTNDES